MSPYRIGLIVLGLLSIGDLAAPLLTDGEHPPMLIALIGAGIGALSLTLLILAWRRHGAAAIGLVTLRLLSALTAVPAFFAAGVPAVPMIFAGTAIVLTVVGSALVLTEVRRPAVVGGP